jgi:hypothetical protein
VFEYLLSSNHTISQGLFIKLVAAAYFFAFLSLHREVLGLFGQQGIVPIDAFLKRVSSTLDKKRWYFVPTLFHFKSDDRTLKLAPFLGIIFSAVAFIGIAPALMLALLWILYLSFVSCGAPFLQFQWDYLLQEVGFLAILLAITTPPPLLLIIALWVLLFRFILTSGLVKLLSGCPEWRSLNAMKYHFETQPLPNLGGYFAHHLFKPISRGICAFALFLEFFPPFLFLGTKEMRLIGGLLNLLLQALILLTGNYAFFNLLAIALTVPLFDNEYLSLMPSFFSSFQALPPYSALVLILNAIGAAFIFLNLFALIRQIWPFHFLDRWFAYLGHWMILNYYGLFAVMTTQRDELIFEGSNDGVEWQEYRLKYKPQMLWQRPKQIAPLQPRLDWQLWFVPLRGKVDWWVKSLLERLLENSPPVLDLFAHVPFPDAPPKYIRVQCYRYHFSSLADWREKGFYWTRTYRGLYVPPVSLIPE